MSTIFIASENNLDVWMSSFCILLYRLLIFFKSVKVPHKCSSLIYSSLLKKKMQVKIT